MKHIKIHPILENEEDYRSKPEIFLEEGSEKIISELKDSLTSVSDEGYLSIYAEYDNVPLIYVVCGMKNYIDILDGVGSIANYKSFSDEVCKLGMLVQEGIERSNIDFNDFKIYVEDGNHDTTHNYYTDDYHEGPTLVCKITINGY
jgi:hypothetical protein